MRITDIDTSKRDACCSGLIKYNSYCIGASTTVYYSTHFSQTLQATVIFVVKQLDTKREAWIRLIHLLTVTENTVYCKM